MISSSICERIRLRGRVRILCIAGVGHVGAIAVAAPATGDPAAAEALFKEARALVEAGDFAAGCPKFAASMALHASASTAINLGKCHEQEGKLASAYSAYQKALTYNSETRGKQRRRGLEALANEGIGGLEPRLPRLRVVVEEAPAGLEITRDGEPVPASAWGEPVPADPGPHELRATAPGRVPEVRSVRLVEGETETVTLTLTPVSAPETRAQDPVRIGPRAGSVPAWAWATGAVGLGLAAGSVYFLVDDLAAIAALKRHCQDVPGGTYCDPGYDYASDNARKSRDLGLFIGLGSAGVMAMSAAIVGIVRSSSAAKKRPGGRAAARPWFSPGSAGLGIVGNF